MLTEVASYKGLDQREESFPERCSLFVSHALHDERARCRISG
jgi:hypothetical protein